MDFPDFLPMPKKYGQNKGKKLALPRTAEEMRQLESRIDQIRDNIKAIAKGLEDGPLSTIILKLGTFELHLKELEALALDHRKEFDVAKETKVGEIKRAEANKKFGRTG